MTVEELAATVKEARAAWWRALTQMNAAEETRAEAKRQMVAASEALQKAETALLVCAHGETE